MPESKPAGRESPDPERQTGGQQRDPVGSGQGTGNKDTSQKNLKSELENLPSNPKGPIDDSLPKKFAKGEGN